MGDEDARGGEGGTRGDLPNGAVGAARNPLIVIGFACALVGLVGTVLLCGLETPPYDDGFFFKRFALNLLRHGELAWNLSDGPVYGITSQLFLAVAVLLTRVAPAFYVLAGKVFLAVCLSTTGVLLMRQACRWTRRPEAGAGLVLLVMTSPLAMATVHSGMETALTFLLVTLALVLEAPARSTSHPLRAAGLTLAVYLCRPDAALIPALAFVVANRRRARLLGLYGVGLAVGLGASLLAFRLYYGTALPLPFYAKTAVLGTRGVAVLPFDGSAKIAHAATFLAFTGPLVWVACRARDSRALPLCVAATGFVLYHLVATQEIMGYRARFYVPALVPLLLAAALAWDVAVAARGRWLTLWFCVCGGAVVAVAYRTGFVENPDSVALDRIGLLAYMVTFVTVAVLALATGLRRHPGMVGLVVALPVAGVLVATPMRMGPVLRDDDYLIRASAEVTSFRGLADVVRCMPGIRQVYHSEIGVVGLALPEARVLDLVGLMSPALALGHPPFDRYCLRDRPEAVFLPHRNYTALNREIVASACLRSYVRVVRLSSSPLYIRDDLAPAFLACARDTEPWR